MLQKQLVADQTAGRGIANDNSFGCHEVVNHANTADRIGPTVKKVLAQDFRTGDIIGSGMRPADTSEMGDAVLAALQ